MRYKWIELVNYAGIYNGMGLNQIKIDFTKCVTNKVIIRGNNGSGKSTLMSAINPNPDSNDKFIINAEARKSLCISDNGIDYVIRYIHPVTNSGRGTTKGYISKMIDGQMVELNPNGNVGSCKDILYSEFNIDSNYLSLAMLSSENRGLVDARPAERKKLLNYIIHTLETYNNIYKKLSKNASVYKESINNLSHKINELGNEVTLQANLQGIENNIVRLEEDRDSTIEAIAAVKIKIGEYMQVLKDNNYDDIVSNLKEIRSSLKNASNSVERKMVVLGINDVNKIEDFLTYIRSELNRLRTDLQSLQTTVPVLLAQRDSESANLEIKRQKLNSLQSEYNYMDLKNMISYLENSIAEYKSVFNKMKLLNISLITKDEFDAAMESIKYLKDISIALTSNYTYDDILAAYNNRNKELEIRQTLNREKEYLTNITQTISEYESKIIEYRAKREIAKELVNRPKECTIDSCPYIEAAFKADQEFSQHDLEILMFEADSAREELDITNKNIDKYTTTIEILVYIKSIERELSSKMKFIRKLPVRKDFEETFMARALSGDHFEDIDDLYAYVDCGNLIEQYKVDMENLNKYKAEYKVYESKNDLIEQILDDIQNLNAKIENITSQIDSNNESIRKCQSEINTMENSESKVVSLLALVNDSLKPLQSQEAELTSIKTTLDDNTSELNVLQPQLEELNKNLGTINSDIKKLSEEKERITHALIMLSDYRAELVKYQDKYVKIDKIRYYSSSSTGIQTLYMQLYMNKIISTANDLLSLLFDGEFILQPFVINENEFRIPCLGNGLIHDDISSMSTAQKSMISLILSFSILHQSATRYNILFLDELDGGLDTCNRSYFITLLDKLMQMLACEQCFIISHNNELNTELADLIVLKTNPNEQYNGNIIWKY